MIFGYFAADGLPYVQGRLIVPNLRFSGTVDFLIDTGSDTTILHPGDAIDLRFPFDMLANPVEVISVGGVQNYYSENGIIVFDGAGTSLEMEVELFVAKPRPELEELDSLLGRDILNQFGMEYNFPRRRIWLTI